MRRCFTKCCLYCHHKSDVSHRLLGQNDYSGPRRRYTTSKEK
ncbi:hypothetical protein LINPERHAP1_LOCUS11635, partial [Linum perenne]